jgi:glycosyltransferase involved in cell wall biosynthesis
MCQSKQSTPLASIIILAKNEERNIERCLRKVFNQNLKDFEVILIDSGSNDKTLQIASKFPVSTKRIKEKDFHHAITRNLGISLSKGKYIVFLTADSYPENPRWLEKLLAPFKDVQVAAAFSRQIPKSKTNPIESAFIEQTYPRIKKRISSKDLNGKDPGKIVLLSDVSSAYRREIACFKDTVSLAEDQEIAVRLLKKNYCIVYAPDSIVRHSHNYSAISLLKRYVASGNSSSKLHKDGFSLERSLRYVVELFAFSLAYVIKSEIQNKVYWFFYSIFYNSLKILAFGLGYILTRIH